MNIVLFEDDCVNELFPITTGKPAYAISCAGYRLVDWMPQFAGNLIGAVRPFLHSLQVLDFTDLAGQLKPELPLTWLINARLVPSCGNLDRLLKFREACAAAGSAIGNRAGMADGQLMVTLSGDSVASAILPTADFLRLQKEFQQQHASIELQPFISAWLSEARDSAVSLSAELELFDYPHDVIKQNMKCFPENIEHRIAHGHYTQQQDGLFLGNGIRLDEQCVFNTDKGPIVIDDNVSIKPFSYFRGPLYIGPGSKISEHASIKDTVSIAHTCKIGGEIEASVIEPYSNKQHHGFLGHSYFGSWINLGAGTCNSDLKNTYGIVNMHYGKQKVSTGMQFVGCVVGDYAKTAINTGIFTGKVVGTGSMVYGFATTNVPSFVNYARSFGEVGNLPPEVIVSTQARMFARRNRQQRPADIQLVHDMYRLTESERSDELSSEPLSL